MRRLPLYARIAGCAGAVLAGAAVALSAYASHGAAGPDRTRLFVAAGLGLAHGIALAALAPSAVSRTGDVALVLLLSGTLLFCGSLAGAHFLGGSTRLAPVGGTAMVAGWLLQAAALARR